MLTSAVSVILWGKDRASDCFLLPPLVCDGGATLEFERSWVPLDLESGSIVSGTKRVRGYLYPSNVFVLYDHMGFIDVCSKIQVREGRSGVLWEMGCLVPE